MKNVEVIPIFQIRNDLVANGSPKALAIVAKLDAVMAKTVPKIDPALTLQENFGVIYEAVQARSERLAAIDVEIRDFFTA